MTMETVWESFEVAWMAAVTWYLLYVAHEIKRGVQHGHAKSI